MSWLCLWTDILDCPKLAELDDSTIGGWILILAATKRHDKAGLVPPVKRLAHWCRRPEMTIRAWISKLEDVGLLDEENDEITVHDWNDWQPRTAGRPKNQRSMSNAERQRAWRERQRNAVTTVTPPLDSPKDNTITEERRVTLPLRNENNNENIFVTSNGISVTPPPDLEFGSPEWKKFHCIKQAGEKWGASNGEAVINDLLRTFDPDIVMEAMDQTWNRFQAELKPAYLRKCCEGKYHDKHAINNGKA